MVSNYLTLYHVARLLHRRYAGSVIAQAYSQNKNTLSLLLYSPEPHTITISCTARDNYILARPGDSRSRRNTIDLFPSLVDVHIESVYISSSDRIVYLKLSDQRWLCIEMFASKATVLLCDIHGEVTDAFLRRNELIGLHRTLQQSDEDFALRTALTDRQSVFTVFTDPENKNADHVQLLKKAMPKLGSLLAEEIVYKTSAVREGDKAIYVDEIVNTASSIVESVIQQEEVRPRIYFEERTPVCFSLIPLDHYASLRSESFDDLFTGIQTFISVGHSASSFSRKKRELTLWLEKESDKAERTIRAVKNELAETSRGDQYELYAKLILANLPLVKKGMASVNLQNSFSDMSTLTIPLDGSLSPQQNAEKYFDRSKKAKIAKKESADRLILLEKRFAFLGELLTKSIEIKESISLKNFIQLHKDALKSLGFMTEKEQEELPPFKIFTVHGGFTVFAGKNSANNDLLTFRHAKPNDLWFHARGSSGSHVVLKIGSAEGTPTKRAIEEAASIAAYYSKMKNAKHVPVAMTERKFIHKPKGAPAGTVALDKEKVIFVSPVLPDSKA